MTNKITKINITDKIKVEYYYGKDKHIAEDIIQNNDMLQYHYFSQDYKIVKSSQIICIIVLEHNNIKTYIGFISLNPPTINKSLRNSFWGKNFLLKLYDIRKTVDGLGDATILSMSRIVFIPSFRGIGIGKYVQDKIIDDLFNNRVDGFDIPTLFIEVSSILLHTMDFTGNNYNKTFINLKNILNEDDYFSFFDTDERRKKGGFNTPKGSKDTTVMANTAFKFNTNYSNVLKIYCKKYYGVDISDEDAVKLDTDASQLFADDSLRNVMEDAGIPLFFYNIIDRSKLLDIIPQQVDVVKEEIKKNVVMDDWL